MGQIYTRPRVFYWGNNLFSKELCAQLSYLASGGIFHAASTGQFLSKCLYNWASAACPYVVMCLSRAIQEKTDLPDLDEKGAKDGAKRSSHSLSYPFEPDPLIRLWGGKLINQHKLL